MPGTHGRLEPVVNVAWQHFNVHTSLITVLASNIRRVSVKKSGDDGSWQQHCGLLLYGSWHIWIPVPWPLSRSRESASGARLKAYGGIQPRVKAQTKAASNTDSFCLLRQIACREMFADLKKQTVFFIPSQFPNHYLSLRIADVSLISNDVETQKNMQSWNVSKEQRSWKVKTIVHWRDALLGLFCELYRSRNTSNTAGDAWSGVSD